MHPGASVASVVLGAIATGASPGTALVVGGLVLAAAAPLFLVRERRVTTVGHDERPMLDRDDGRSAAQDAVEARDE